MNPGSSMKNKLTLLIGTAAFIVAASVWPCLASTIPYPVTTAISVTQNSASNQTLSNGNVLETVNVTFTNTGSTSLTDAYFVLTEAQGCVQSSCFDMQWNNTSQEWTYTFGSITYSVEPYNPTFFLTLDPSITNISPPSAFGVSAGDSVPAWLISSDLPAGTPVTEDIDLHLQGAGLF